MNAADYFARTETITIATTARDGREIATPIWGVLVDGVPYIRNGFGEGSAWYRRLRRTGRAAFLAGDHRYEADVELVDDEPVKQAVDAAYTAKYGGRGSGAREVVSSPARDYTLRVALAEEP